jgi:ATP-dependent protease HslVU (ClpYQ) peptidase subunit
MTTIAYDGKTLAVDSQATAGNTVFGETNKLFPLSDGRYAALAGCLSVFPEVVAWLNGEGEMPDLSEEESFGGIIVSPDGSAVEITKNMRLFPASIPWSGGSGEAIAFTAMHLGKTAEEAVELACTLDIYTGGSITSVEICI